MAAHPVVGHLQLFGGLHVEASDVANPMEAKHNGDKIAKTNFFHNLRLNREIDDGICFSSVL